jgi:cytochrome c biogenesis protein CcdA
MGIIMYFILICFILLALMCIVLGVMLIFTPQILGVTGMSALAILVGVVLLVLGIGITAFLNEFFKTSDRSDF